MASARSRAEDLERVVKLAVRCGLAGADDVAKHAAEARELEATYVKAVIRLGNEASQTDPRD